MRKARKKRIIILSVILALCLAYGVWLAINLIRFETYPVFESNRSAQEIVGIYHIHTKFSDGRKTIEEVAQAASDAALDFIIVTDHGSPNRESMAAEGWKHGVLVLAGSELSVSRGHLVALNIRDSAPQFSQNAETASNQITQTGGFSIIAHPYSKASWSWGKFTGYSGLEIMNADSLLKTNLHLLLPNLPALLLSPRYALLKIVRRPLKNLRKWDQLNSRHRVYGYFSADAHLFYGTLFQFLRLHLLLQEPLSSDFKTARNQVYTCLIQGRFFNAVDAAASSQGFRFWAISGETRIPMGGKAPLTLPTTLHTRTPYPFQTETRLLRNGRSIFWSKKKEESIEVESPGTYRVEIYLRERTPLDKSTPWIVSNPIFIRKDTP